MLLCASSIWATSLAQYRQNVHQAATELITLQSAEESDRVNNQALVLRTVRKLLPARQKIETSEGTDFEVDNSWLETNLKDYENASPGTKRFYLLQAAAERLGALEDRLKEFETSQAGSQTKNADKQKLDEILRRPEFQKPSEEKEKSILDRWLDSIAKWLASFFGSRQPIEKPQVDLSSLGAILNYLIIAVAVAIIGFVVWRFLLPLIGNKPKRQKNKEPRIILGEQIAPDATADDLLTQADRLAQAGELRAAIRKGYIAALCDLSDRKVLGLAKHKTNRDYLRDVKKRTEIYQPMSGMTGIFERHWYGDIPAENEDWQTFRGQLKIISQQSTKN